MLHAPRVVICLAVAALWLAACQPQRPTPVPAWPTLTPSATAKPLASATPLAPSPTPAPGEGYPPPTPTPGEGYPPPTAAAQAYPEPVEAEVVQGRAITILALQPGPDSVRVSGGTTLPNEACIQTELYANASLVSWWPTAQCASVRDGRWVLAFERPALGEQAPPGARYTVIARAPAHPEAGEARLVLQAFIPYHGGGN